MFTVVGIINQTMFLVFEMYAVIIVSSAVIMAWGSDFCLSAAACCPPMWEPWGGSCYRSLPAPITWGGAQSVCREMGGKVAAPRSREENDILSLMGHDMNAYWLWIACSEENGEWKCEGQETGTSYSDWLPGEPSGSGNCAAIRTLLKEDYGQWNDIPCTFSEPGRFGAVCIRRPKQPRHNGLSTYVSDRLLSSSCLLDHTIIESAPKTVCQCAVVCINELMCRSFNIKMTDEQNVCQLNNATRDDDPDKFQDVGSFCVYYEPGP